MSTISVTSSVIGDSRESLTVSFTVTEASTDATNNSSTINYDWSATQNENWHGTTRKSGGELKLLIDGSQIVSKTIPLNKESSRGTSWTGTGSTVVKHNTDGAKKVSFKINLEKGRGYANGYEQDQDPMVYAAATKEGNLTLTNIDRTGPVITISKSSTTSTSATINFAISNVKLDLLDYYCSKDNKWISLSLDSRSFTIDQLQPNCTYTVKLKARRKYNQVETIETITIKTSKPALPRITKKPKVSQIPQEITDTFDLVIDCTGIGEATSPAKVVKYSGSIFEHHPELPTIKKEEYEVTASNNWSYTAYNCKPETKYGITVYAHDNFDQKSVKDTKYDVYIITDSHQAKLWYRVGGQWQLGKVWYKEAGTWQKVKKAYIKDNTGWKKAK